MWVNVDGDGVSDGRRLLTVLKMLTRTRKRVMSRAILPGITSGGTTKLIHDTTTNSPGYARTFWLPFFRFHRCQCWFLKVS